MKISGRKIVSKLSCVWSDEYFGSNNRNARGKRYSHDGAIIRNANRKFRYDKSWKEAA
jgi:hypothetical protein